MEKTALDFFMLLLYDKCVMVCIFVRMAKFNYDF